MVNVWSYLIPLSLSFPTWEKKWRTMLRTRPGIQGLLNKPEWWQERLKLHPVDCQDTSGVKPGWPSRSTTWKALRLIHPHAGLLPGGKVKCCSHRESPFLFEMTELDQRLRPKGAPGDWEEQKQVHRLYDALSVGCPCLLSFFHSILGPF